MFEGSVSEQLHQFLTPRTTPPNSNSLPLPLNFALHSPNFNFHPFDSYNSSIHLHHPHHLLHPSSNPHENGHDKGDSTTTAATTATVANNLQVAMDLEIGRESNNNRSILMEDHHQWSNDELLALLRVRSNIDNCFPESTWEHVSRKLGEVGFRRTAEKCKEKFEEESRYFNHINYNKSSRYLTHELNYHPHQHHNQDQDHLLLIHGGNGKPDDGETVVVVPEEAEEEKEANFRERDIVVREEEATPNAKERKNKNNNIVVEEEQESSRSRICKKRKRKMMRQKEFEMLKSYCEEIVKQMMTQQEEIHSKLLHDMLKREEEKIAKEECWKKQQMERLHKELEVMAHEQAIASDRQATIIEILNQITNNSTISSSSQSKKDLQNLLITLNDINNINVPNSPSSSSLIQTQTSSPNKDQQQQVPLVSSSSLKAPPHENSSSFTSQNDQKNPKNPSLSTQILASQDPNSFINHSNQPPSSIQKLPQNPKSRDKELDDLGKRWPRDEVLALVNVRCSLYNNGGGAGGGDQDQSDGTDEAASLKAPLWERISQGMLQLGYKRSAKRCKEKWENINKYFRKTKDVKKKRSLDSRTCPYFHQLSTLYNQGGGSKRSENCPIASENHSDQSENLPNSS